MDKVKHYSSLLGTWVSNLSQLLDTFCYFAYKSSKIKPAWTLLHRCVMRKGRLYVTDTELLPRPISWRIPQDAAKRIHRWELVR